MHNTRRTQNLICNAGEVFGWPSLRTWEFTSSHPIRSVFPLWLAYGFPLTILKWLWEGLGYGEVPPLVGFYTLRVVMFILSFVLEDWALHELIPSPRERTWAIALVASSYVTWTFQTHTFSNSIETLLVLWCIVLMKRIRENRNSTMASACCGLALMGVLGVFNRITFPAFLVIPAVQLVPHLFTQILRLPLMLVTSFITLAIAITMDTEFYTGIRPRVRDLHTTAVVTPWNNLAYNLVPSNLAVHGLHPLWQHFAANLPQLLGPAIPLLLFSSRKNTLFWSAIIGTAILSYFQHQEPRFLLPAVPLLLASIKVPRRFITACIIVWALFNITGGSIFGIYHQGGVVPAQTWIANQNNVKHVYWWKTYSPPQWLLDGQNDIIKTEDLMGMDGSRMMSKLFNTATCAGQKDRKRERVDPRKVLLVAPASAAYLDPFTSSENVGHAGVGVMLKEVYQHQRHIGLDDLDFGDDGVWPTLRRVVGRRGLVVYQVNKEC